MSKVTGKDLQRLIEGALNEKYEFEGSADDFLKDLSVRKTVAVTPLRNKVVPIQKLDNPPNKYTASDVAKAITSPANTPRGKKIKKAAATIAAKTTNDAFQQDISGLINVAEIPKVFDLGGTEPERNKKTGELPTSIDIESFSFPRPLGDLSTSGEGKFLGSQNELIRSVFTEPTLSKRLEKIDQISTDLSQPPEELANMDPRTLLQFTMVADLFDLFLNQIDQRAGGYLFETFLANLAGGKVSGGSNGIADFETNGNPPQKGSAKLYKSWSNMTQSHGDGETGWKKIGESIHYVIGIHDAKKQVLKRTEIKLYYVVFTLQSINTDKSKVIAFSNADGVVKNKVEFEEGSPMEMSTFSNKDDYYIGKFDLGKAGEGYRERLTAMIDDTDAKGDGKVALSAMKKFFTHLYNAEENTKKYTAQKDATETKFGDAALEAYDAADAQLQDLLNILTPDKTVQGEKGKRKITKEHILKLIEESFKK